MSDHTAYTGLDSVVTQDYTPGTPRGPVINDVAPAPCDTCERKAECRASGHECAEFKIYVNGEHWQRSARKSRAGPGGRRQKIPQRTIEEIRRRGHAGETGEALAREFGCNPAYARRIIRGEVRA